MLADRRSNSDASAGSGRRSQIDLGRVFSAVADPTRRAILARLAEGSATVSELAEPFEMSLPAVSKHIKVLERAGLLERDIVGRVHHCRARLEPLLQAEAWIAQRQAFWDRGLESLRSFLDGPGSVEEDDAPGIVPDRALAIVRRDRDGEWRIERLMGGLPAARHNTHPRR